ncbi:MAG: DUF2956 domain-containing protein [Gammaproteobacteria bacterium]|nr:DUF2956 domain-containing protein [Gammaproteobacteria bacterium]
MSRYSRKNSVTDKTKDEAMKIARGTQRPGQSKEQTKLIAQGIQKGIDHYKKQQNAKARELDKKLKKAAASRISGASSIDNPSETVAAKCSRLPWVLLVVSWLGFAAIALAVYLM